MDEKLPQLFVAFGWLTHPGKIVDINLTPVQENWLHAGLLAGECAMFIIIAMVCVSLSKRVPYHLFHLVHRLFPVFYLAIAFHVFTALFKSYWWNSCCVFINFNYYSGRLCGFHFAGNDSNLLIVFYVQIMPDDFVMQLHRF
ncbi:hypothetical protein [Escherichia coli]|uniref:hypothetical protein n=1 Tax=Escherichia coli TaxID=562 RepID=UPI0037DCE9F6